MAEQIPIRNLWLLMLYASDIYQLLPEKSAGAEDNPDELPDLISEVLCHAVEKRLHRNLTAGYQRTTDVLSRVRGKIRMLDTERHQLLQKGKVSCSFDQLSVDTPRNRFVMAALEKCVFFVTTASLTTRCRRNIESLRLLGVGESASLRWDISQDRISRNDRDDILMLSAAKLAHEFRIPTEEDGRYSLPDTGQEERWLRRLFEKAVSGFYKVSARSLGWRVRPGKHLNWQVQSYSERIPELLPKMITDIYLENKQEGKRLIIDTKFNSILTSGHHREFTFRSGYIYQIYAYILSQVSVDDPLSDSATGILLHPSVGEDLDETVDIQGHRFRFSTVNLASTSQAIRQQLLQMLN